MSTPVRRPWLLVAQREIHVKLRDRNFLISTGLTSALLLGFFVVQAFLGGGSTSHTVAAAGPDAAQVVRAADGTLAGENEIRAEVVNVADREAGVALVEDDGADVLLVPDGSGWEMVGQGPVDPALRAALTQAATDQGLADTAAELGTTVEELTAGTAVTVTDLDSEDEGAAALKFIAGLVFAMVFYVASIMFGLNIAMSVVEEKQSRIVEILAAAIPVRQLLTGKVVGNTVLALAQIGLLTAVVLVGITFTDYGALLGGLTEAVLWYVPFFLAGFLSLACLWAAGGALASRTEDVQTTTTPLTLVLVGMFFLALSVDGTVERVLSFVPLISTILMPTRLLSGDVPLWEPVLALVLTLAFAALMIGVGTRLYRRALLKTQGRLGWRAAWSAGE